MVVIGEPELSVAVGIARVIAISQFSILNSQFGRRDAA